MRFCLLASGSQGNAALLDYGSTRLLVDAGLSAREICRRLDLVGIEHDSIDALLITHEHTDHIRGLGPLARRLNLQVCLHTDLVGHLRDVGRVDAVKEFETGSTWQIGDVEVQAFSITHDAKAPVGFTFTGKQGKIGFATDLGVVTRLVEQQLQNCRAVVIETNHDEAMLRDGPYPWHLKQRIKSNHGHLSNSAGSQLLNALLWPGLEAVTLAHLSETNNCPELAYKAACAVIERQSQCSPTLTVGGPDAPTSWLQMS